MGKKEASKANQQRKDTTLVALHSVKNILGHETQLSLFSEHNLDAFSKTYGIPLNEKITRFGIDLTDLQLQVMEGILRGFTETDYRGNIEPIDKSFLLEEKFAFGELPSAYKYINKIPCLRASQSQILKWACINQNSIAEKERAIEALKHLGTTQYCFYYDRLALDSNGVAEKDSYGKWKKEEVISVDTMFTIKEVRDKESTKLSYYEIIPSPIFLDQRESYFMLIPNDWRKEVTAVVGNKRASSYTFLFLTFLRYQFEMKRRSIKNESQDFTIRWHWEEIAIALKMPESVYKRKKARALKILDDAYFVAKQLGYLTDYWREESVDCLILNREKYLPSTHSIKQLEKVSPSISFSKEAMELFQFFHEEKRKIDSKHPLSVGKIKNDHLKSFEDLLKDRTYSEILEVIKWGFNLNFWCTQLGTPAKLKQNFGKALIEMKNSIAPSKNQEDSRINENRELVQKFLDCNNYASQSRVKIDLLNAYVEIGNGLHQPTCIPYKEKGFKDIFENCLRKWKLL
jgi:hypothetical protein